MIVEGRFWGLSPYNIYLITITWLVKDGDYVKKGQIIAELLIEWMEDGVCYENTDNRESCETGIISLNVADGAEVDLDTDVLYFIDTSAPKPEPIKLKYFLPAISLYRPLKVTCPICETETTFNSHIRMTTAEGTINLWCYQCQSCGKLKSSEDTHPDGIRIALEDKCKCGGQFRRDKNIFCPSCNYRKTAENRAEDYLHASAEEMEKLEMRHGNEAME